MLTRMVGVHLALLLAAGGADGFSTVEETGAIRVESRPVEGSSFDEVRVTLVGPHTVEAVCASALGDGSVDPGERGVVLRRVVMREEDARVFYERRVASPFHDRDFAVKARRTRLADGSCRVDFALANGHAPPPQDGVVRMVALRGSWLVEPLDAGRVRLTYVVHSDPGGAIPGFLARSSQRKVAVAWAKLVLDRAR